MSKFGGGGIVHRYDAPPWPLPPPRRGSYVKSWRLPGGLRIGAMPWGRAEPDLGRLPQQIPLQIIYYMSKRARMRKRSYTLTQSYTSALHRVTHPLLGDNRLAVSRHPLLGYDRLDIPQPTALWITPSIDLMDGKQ